MLRFRGGGVDILDALHIDKIICLSVIGKEENYVSHRHTNSQKMYGIDTPVKWMKNRYKRGVSLLTMLIPHIFLILV